VVVEQIIRPTGLLDPKIEVKPADGQVDDLHHLISQRVAKGQRVLVTTLTKRMAEDLTDYFEQLGVRVRYMHSDVKTLERVQLIRELRLGEYDVMIGINLLREGLDLPEVGLVAVLDADKEGFLRSSGALIQTAGRAARNLAGTVIFYADNLTESMKRAMEETARRRGLQEEYNRANGITPSSINKAIEDGLASIYEADYAHVPQLKEESATGAGGRYGLPAYLDRRELEEMITRLEREMLQCAERLEFEQAAEVRDRLRGIKEEALLNMDLTSEVK